MGSYQRAIRSYEDREENEIEEEEMVENEIEERKTKKWRRENEDMESNEIEGMEGNEEGSGTMRGRRQSSSPYL